MLYLIKSRQIRRIYLFRETCKSQIINPISPTPKFPFGYHSYHKKAFNYALLLGTEYLRPLCSMLHLIELCNMTAFRKENILLFYSIPGVRGVSPGKVCATMSQHESFPLI